MTNLSNYLKTAEEIDLSGADIHKITDGKCVPMSYHELEKYNSLNELFESSNAIMLLYEIEGINTGHWVLLIRHNKAVVEFFDPYALNPDEELKYSKIYYRTHKKNDVPHLQYLLYNQNQYSIIINKCKLQKLLGTVNTCGRHCGSKGEIFRLNIR